ncbi:hypothetical protein N9S81_00425, partial [bacterium]|nr:hypothetical protein [bacterium]
IRPQDHQLGAVAFTAQTDFHTTASKSTTSVFALGQNQSVKLSLPEATLEIDKDTPEFVSIVLPGDTRINMTCMQYTLGIDGTLTNAMNGQASVLLKDVLKETGGGGAYTVKAGYCGWKDTAATVTLAACKVGVEPCLSKTLGKSCKGVKLRFKDDEVKTATLENAYKLLETLYDDAAETRSEIVFQIAPNLTKPVMSVPVGINNSKFDVSAAICDRPQSFTDEALDSLVMGGVKSVCGFQQEKNALHNEIIDVFFAETSTPSIRLASRWATVAADALSAANSVIMPYRVDGRTVLLPTGGDLLQSESWFAEAHRGCRAADDCEGSGSLIVSIANRCAEVARDPKLAKQFPALRGIGNALRHHVVGLSVLAANAGSADESGKDHAAVAGHAACVAISKPSVANAIRKGFECKLRDDGHDQEAITTASNKLVCAVWDALYADDRRDLPLTPLDEQNITMASETDNISEKILALQEAASTVTPVFDHVASAGPLSALGIEGTAPVSPTLLYSPNKSDRVARQAHTRNDKTISSIMKQNVGRAVSIVDVDPNDYNKNKFYKSFVEVMVSTKSALCTSTRLRQLGYASPHFVFAQTACSGAAGCTPKEIALNDFKLVPLYRLDAESGQLFDESRQEVSKNTLPMRGEVERLGIEETKIYYENMDALMDLDTLRLDESDRTHTLQYLLTMASLTARGGIRAFIESIKKKKKGEIGVEVQRHELNGLLQSDAGENLGHFVSVQVRCRVR